ncbi:LrgB family protein [Vallitalea pronyensis]|uniref:LrgB family protein n=1 Tax=Vallitalea pronyensis TaxID=1348613 RepID=A0A8J8MIS3_9FIRM|nr:LrgB family protein [Vallitalea pronyensis]QUI22281.1 LrgB family protein [Vallitalea pronyensis]
MKEILTHDVLFGLAITIIMYKIGVMVNKKLGVIANSLLIAMIGIIGVLLAFDIPFDAYNQGGSIISGFINPATVALALPLYKNFDLVKKYFHIISISVISGILASTLSVMGLSYLFHVGAAIKQSLIPKTVTTAIALPLSESVGGILSLTVIAVIMTGIVGTIFGPVLFKLLKVKHPIAQGVALGTSSHAIGTSKAVEIGQEVGAISSISLILAGVMMTILIEII